MMAKKKKNRTEQVDTTSDFWFTQRLMDVVNEQYRGRVPEQYSYLIYLLNNPKLLVRGGEKHSVKSKEDKNFNVDMVMAELLDDLQPEERFVLIPDTFEQSKQMNKFANQTLMNANEDTIWRKITGYANVNREMINLLAQHLQGKKTLEIMAGNGLLSYMLMDAGVNVFATDLEPGNRNEYIAMQKGCYGDVVKFDAVSAIKKHGAQRDCIICSWPPCGEEEIIKALEAYQKVNPNGILLYIGEWKGGFNATDKFFDAIEIVDMLNDVNEKHISHIGSKDVLRFVRLK